MREVIAELARLTLLTALVRICLAAAGKRLLLEGERVQELFVLAVVSYFLLQVVNGSV